MLIEPVVTTGIGTLSALVCDAPWPRDEKPDETPDVQHITGTYATFAVPDALL